MIHIFPYFPSCSSSIFVLDCLFFFCFSPSLLPCFFVFCFFDLKQKKEEKEGKKEEQTRKGRKEGRERKEKRKRKEGNIEQERKRNNEKGKRKENKNTGKQVFFCQFVVFFFGCSGAAK